MRLGLLFVSPATTWRSFPVLASQIGIDPSLNVVMILSSRMAKGKE